MQYGSGEMVSIPMENDKRCQGYYVLPQNHKGALSAGVILLHDAMAFLKSHNVGYADNIAGEGYQVVIPEYIEPSNVPKISIAHVKDFSQWKSGFDAKSVFEMIVASATYLRSKGVQTIGIVGLGFGAEVGFQFSMECGKRIDLRMMAGICPTGLPTCALVHGKFKLYCFLGGMEGFITNDELQEFKNNATELGLDTLIKKYPRMGHGYAYSCIMNEDTAVATISEVLDALQLYLIDFKAALGTSDNDQWWPQGKNGPFVNVGLKNWLDMRNHWKVYPFEKPSVTMAKYDTDEIVRNVNKLEKTLELPGPMPLAQLVQVLLHVWDE